MIEKYHVVAYLFNEFFEKKRNVDKKMHYLSCIYQRKIIIFLAVFLLVQDM